MQSMHDWTLYVRSLVGGRRVYKIEQAIDQKDF